MRIQGRLSAWSRPVKMTFLTGRGLGLCTPDLPPEVFLAFSARAGAEFGFTKGSEVCDSSLLCGKPIIQCIHDN